MLSPKPSTSCDGVVSKQSKAASVTMLYEPTLIGGCSLCGFSMLLARLRVKKTTLPPVSTQKNDDTVAKARDG